MKTFFCIPLVVFGIVATACAQMPSLPTEYQHWLDEDVSYIMTDAERKDFIARSGNGDPDNFVREFWERRNPTPGSAENPYKEEHYRRMAFANEHFAATVAGWKTDRGKAYIQMGPPDSVHTLIENGVHGEIWHYAAPAMESRPANLLFVDHCNCGDYKLERHD
jgi:GWxTD domain-containing protein